MQKENKPFCYAPWISVTHSNTMGGTGPCCEWRGELHLGTLTTYQNSKYLKKIKKDMLNHNMSKLNKSCIECMTFERTGNLKSRRLRYHSYVEKGTCDPAHIIEFDYRPSNLCNLKCKMCNPLASSMIAKDLGVNYPNIIRPNDYKNLDMSNLQQIYISGGEPSIIKEVYEFLEYCESIGINKTCYLSVCTNATNVNKRWLDLLSKWKHLDVTISLDGTGKALEYIREGATWSSLEKNCLYYENTYESVAYQTVVMAYNVPNLEDWFDWFVPKSKLSITPVFGKDYLTLDTVPTEILDSKIDYLKKLDVAGAKVLLNLINEAKFNKKLLKQLKHKTLLDEMKTKKSLLDVSSIYSFIYN